METTFAGTDWLLHDDWWGNPPLAWIVAGSAGVLGFLLVRTALGWARHRISRRADRRTGRRGGTALRSVVAALDGVRTGLLVLLAIVIPLAFLDFTHQAEYWLHLFTFLLIGLQLVLCINRVIVTWLLRSVDPAPPFGEVPVMLGILTWGCQFIVWMTFLLALLTNAGVNITAFVASLGIGGIAVALALQNILGDLFASVAIGLDKPFEPGEFIAFGDYLGTVKHVGVKTTRIASLSGEQLAISNTQLLGNLIHNYSRMPERRVVFGFTVPYHTPREKLREIVDRTNRIIVDAEPVRFDRGHFTGFGPDGFTFEFVYYMLDSGYALYRDVQQDINEQIVDLLDGLDVGFAVPARAIAIREPARVG